MNEQQERLCLVVLDCYGDPQYVTGGGTLSKLPELASVYRSYGNAQQARDKFIRMRQRSGRGRVPEVSIEPVEESEQGEGQRCACTQ